MRIPMFFGGRRTSMDGRMTATWELLLTNSYRRPYDSPTEFALRCQRGAAERWRDAWHRHLHSNLQNLVYDWKHDHDRKQCPPLPAKLYDRLRREP
jgi:hypothetical protein